MILKTVSMGGLLLALAACEAPAPSPAQIVLRLPTTAFAAGLAEFEAVCFDGKADNPDDAFLFEFDQREDGKTLCAMRARAPENVDVSGTLRARFGPMRTTGTFPIISILENYPRGLLIHRSGIGNSAGEGTYQLATVRD